jgi:hypothetical protein
MGADCSQEGPNEAGLEDIGIKIEKRKIQQIAQLRKQFARFCCLWVSTKKISSKKI